MTTATYRPIAGQGVGYGLVNGGLLAIIGVGLFAAHYMDANGHHVTGMSNQIVWGLPHVFAVFLIVAASGALNVASLASMFGRDAYAPLSRLSGLLAIALLSGGLAILVLDLGRPDRLIVAMTHYNFKSIFAWNIFLYSGFLVLTVGYLWMLMERRFNRYATHLGVITFVWRIALTIGTGCIFGVLVARPAYEMVILVPLFIAMSLSFGLAVFILVAVSAFRGAAYPQPYRLLRRLRRLLGIFSAVVLCLVVAQHAINFDVADHHTMERFFLVDGGVYPVLFWVGQVGAGSLIPMLMTFHSRFADNTRWLMVAAGLVVAGAFCQLYVLIIGGQAFPLRLFGNLEIIESTFFDGVVASYHPSLPELALGVGGLAMALLIVTLGLKVFHCLPDGASD